MKIIKKAYMHLFPAPASITFPFHSRKVSLLKTQYYSFGAKLFFISFMSHLDLHRFQLPSFDVGFSAVGYVFILQAQIHRNKSD